jgi:hypothetical protein
MYHSVKALQYCLFSRHSRGHGVHPPFLYALITQVFNDKYNYPEYECAVNIISKHAEVTVKSIKHKYSQLLCRLIKHFNINNICSIHPLLLTDMAYIYANKGVCLNIINSKQLAEILKEYMPSINQVFFNKKMDHTTANPGMKNQPYGLVYFDLYSIAKSDMISFFNSMLNKAANDTVFVFRNIHKSIITKRNWVTLTGHPAKTLSVDILEVGLVFIKKELSRQHFVIRY